MRERGTAPSTITLVSSLQLGRAALPRLLSAGYRFRYLVIK
jgi:hypothetical protein